MSRPHRSTSPRASLWNILVPLIIGALLIVGVVVSLLIGGVIHMKQQADLIAHGVPATATVVKTDIQYVTVRGGGFNAYSIDYRFHTGGKTITRHNLEIYHDEWQTLRRGSSLPVRYAANNPAANLPSFALHELSPGATLLIRMVCGFLAVAVFFFLQKHTTLLRRLPKRGFIMLIVVLLCYLAGHLAGDYVALGIGLLLF